MKSKIRLNSFYLEGTLKRGEWTNSIYKIEAGAWYNPQENGIIIPYPTLDGWIFDADRPEPLNVATLTGGLHHEITHGFDSNGRHTNYEGISLSFDNIFIILS